MADDETTAFDLAGRPHSWRHYEPEDFIEANRNDPTVEVRKELQIVESGRFYDMLEAGHKFFRALDPDERRDFAQANPDLIAWIGVYAHLNHLNTFEEYTGIESGIGV
jgi:hypothetical protein